MHGNTNLRRTNSSSMHTMHTMHNIIIYYIICIVESRFVVLNFFFILLRTLTPDI